MSLLDDVEEEATAQEGGVDLDSAYTADLLRHAGREVSRLREHVTLLEANVGSAVAVKLSRQHTKEGSQCRAGKRDGRLPAGRLI